MNKHELFDLYKSVIKKPGGISFIPHTVAHNFINDCIKHDFAIVGIDRFRLVNGTEPLEIADFSDYKESSWEKYKMELAKFAIEFIDEFESEEGIYYDFVIVPKVEWKK
mgnify:CR=1 FL=1